MGERKSNIAKKIVRFFIGIIILCIAGALTACNKNISTNNEIEEGNNNIKESEILAYVKTIDTEKKTVILDRVEWLTLEDTERLAELGKSAEDLPSGFYIYNEEEKNEIYEYIDSLQINIMEEAKPMPTNIKTFIDLINRHQVLCNIKLKDNKIIEISEQYVP